MSTVFSSSQHTCSLFLNPLLKKLTFGLLGELITFFTLELDAMTHGDDICSWRRTNTPRTMIHATKLSKCDIFSVGYHGCTSHRSYKVKSTISPRNGPNVRFFRRKGQNAKKTSQLHFEPRLFSKAGLGSIF
jgi:hypothetical protein